MLLCSCVLMSRVSSHEVKERCIKGFFDMCPTPSDFAGLDVEALAACVHSLGFQYERMRGLADVTNAWLTRGEFAVDNVPCTKGGNKIVQCGAFAVDSYYVFCKGDAARRV